MKKSILLYITLLTAFPIAHAGKDTHAPWYKKVFALWAGAAVALANGSQANPVTECIQLKNSSSLCPTRNHNPLIMLTCNYFLHNWPEAYDHLCSPLIKISDQKGLELIPYIYEHYFKK